MLRACGRALGRRLQRTREPLSAVAGWEPAPVPQVPVLGAMDSTIFGARQPASPPALPLGATPPAGQAPACRRMLGK